MRLSLDTLYLLQESADDDDLSAIEIVHDLLYCSLMYGDVRYAAYYDLRLDRIQLLPKEGPMTKKTETEETKTKNGMGQKVVETISLLVPTLQAIKAWVKATSKWGKN